MHVFIIVKSQGDSSFIQFIKLFKQLYYIGHCSTVAYRLISVSFSFWRVIQDEQLKILVISDLRCSISKTTETSKSY
jgi:hypothetical protein